MITSVGVLEGTEDEQRYHLMTNVQENYWLVPGEEERMTAGMTYALIPPAENIHQVHNKGIDAGDLTAYLWCQYGRGAIAFQY